MGASLIALEIADPPERWRALGFAVQAGRVEFDGVTIALAAGPGRAGGSGRGIVAWAVSGAPEAVAALELPTLGEKAPSESTFSHRVAGAEPGRPGAEPSHPNTTIGIDHLVVTTPDFDATASALEAAGLPFRRIREAGPSTRQGFRRLGPAILEVVEAPGTPAPAFWGLTLIAANLETLRRHAGRHLGEARPAVQPGRRIAVVAPSAGLTTRLAFMDPEPGPG